LTVPGPRVCYFARHQNPLKINIFNFIIISLTHSSALNTSLFPLTFAFACKYTHTSIVYAYERICSFTYTIPAYLGMLQDEKRETREMQL
jgi:hypothetical protein